MRQLGKARKGGGIWDILFFIEVELIHNVSGIRQSDSDVHILKYGLPRSTDGKESACNVGDLGSLGWDDPLEEGMATHSSVPA